jgi:adenine-specific DNA-methyltransferase
METLNYIGSKHTLQERIFDIINITISDVDTREFADLFAGTGTMGFNAKRKFKSVIANDMEQYAFVINYALLKCNYTPSLQQHIHTCNALGGVEGLIFQEYSPGGPSERMFFTVDNAKKCDAIRQWINAEYKANRITEEEYYFLLASLLVSTDKVANTASVYGAYLKEFKASAVKPLTMKPVHQTVEIPNKDSNRVFNVPIEQLVPVHTFDVVYLDPPYNQRQYSANYSPLNYIAQYDPAVQLKGKTGLIDNYSKSQFCSRPKVEGVFELIVEKIQCKYLILSYNNEGLLSVDSLKKILMTRGSVILYKMQYKKFKAQQAVKEKFVEEYLWVVKIGDPPEFTEVIYENIV